MKQNTISDRKDYSRIIDHPHFQSKKRPRMTMMQRAAQFAPFAALTGYTEAVNETERVTDDKRLLAEDAMTDIDRTLRYAMLSHKPVSITYYIPDPGKPGGSYVTATGCIHQVDMLEDVVILDDGSVILLYNITDAEIVDDAPDPTS
ncbi:MAG: YolD-like family protein [Lachnospiraceae bacterium]|nr:YolD-like family protein [Lachnospiraceae bacterium]